MVKAVIFDVGGVLVTAPQRIIADVEKRLGLPRGAISRVFVQGAPENAFCRMERGEIPLSEFTIQFDEECRQMAAMAGFDMPTFSSRQLFARISNELSVVPEMMEAVLKLKKAGYKTGIITNNWIDDTRPKTGVPSVMFPDNMFDVILESCRLGMRKPDENIYKLACKKLGVEPHEAVFLDDLGVNLKSASKLGMRTILVRDSNAALKELQTALREDGDGRDVLLTTHTSKL